MLERHAAFRAAAHLDAIVFRRSPDELRRIRDALWSGLVFDTHDPIPWFEMACSAAAANSQADSSSAISFLRENVSDLHDAAIHQALRAISDYVRPRALAHAARLDSVAFSILARLLAEGAGERVAAEILRRFPRVWRALNWSVAYANDVVPSALEHYRLSASDVDSILKFNVCTNLAFDILEHRLDDHPGVEPVLLAAVPSLLDAAGTILAEIAPRSLAANRRYAEEYFLAEVTEKHQTLESAERLWTNSSMTAYKISPLKMVYALPALVAGRDDLTNLYEEAIERAAVGIQLLDDIVDLQEDIQKGFPGISAGFAHWLMSTQDYSWEQASASISYGSGFSVILQRSGEEFEEMRRVAESAGDPFLRYAAIRHFARTKRKRAQQAALLDQQPSSRVGIEPTAIP